MQVGFIGAGRMASAMVSGLLAKRLYPAEAIGCTCGDDPTGPQLAEKTGIRWVAEAGELIHHADVLVLACKPQQLDTLDPVYTAQSQGRLVLSILAGTTLARLRATFPEARNIARAMPNTPGQIGAGITAFAPLQTLASEDRKAVLGILGALGDVLELPEAQLDAVTAISGSGPAYVFEFTAALREAGSQLGLSSDVADQLARQTVIGAARLMDSAAIDPENLRNAVTSKGGTTEAALKTFAEGGLRKLVSRAAAAAEARSRELA
ncbi:MAG: pyrroline-5-carboxylate reductase [Opitutales bacterium]